MVIPSSTMHRSKKGAVTAKTRSLRRAELLLLEVQQDILEERIRVVEKLPQPPTAGRKLKREPNGPPLPDRTEGNKRAKHDLGGSMTTEEMLNQCRKLLTQLKKNNNSGPFLAPVDPIALNCPDYFKIVTQPMDFKTITTKLRPTKRQYETPLAFRDDVRQVFKNCTLYNPIGNQIRIMGDRLSAYFESLWAKSNLERYYQRRQETLKRVRTLIVKRVRNFYSCEMQERKEDPELTEEGNGGRSKKMCTYSPEDTLKKLSAIETKMQELMSAASEKGDIRTMSTDSPMTFWQKRKLSQELEKASEFVMMDVCKALPERSESDEKVEMTMDEMKDDAVKRLWSAAIPTELPASEPKQEEQKGDPSAVPDKQPEEERPAAEVDAEKATTETAICTNEQSPELGLKSDASPKEADPEEAVPKDADTEDADPEEAVPKDADTEEAVPKEADPKEADPEGQEAPEMCEPTANEEVRMEDPSQSVDEEKSIIPEDKTEETTHAVEIAEEQVGVESLTTSVLEEEAEGKDTETQVLEVIKHSDSGNGDFEEEEEEERDTTKSSLCAAAAEREPVNGTGEMKEATAQETVLQSADP